MNLLDLIIGIVLVIFAISGLRKGLILEAFFLASYIIGIYGAMFFSDVVAAWMSKFIDAGSEYVMIIAFIVTFVLILLLIRLLGRLISNIVDAINLGFLDKLGGFFFGILKGALVVSIFIMIMNVFGITGFINKEARDKSFLYTTTEQIANTLYKNHDVVKESVSKSIKKVGDVFETSLTK